MDCFYCLRPVEHGEIAHGECGIEWQRRICAHACVKCAGPNGGTVTCHECRAKDGAPWVGYPPGVGAA